MQTTRRNFFTLLTVAILSALVTLALTSSVPNAAARQEITGANNHIITLEQAVKYVENYAKAPAYSVKGGYFDRGIFEKILAQDGCLGIRCYYGRNDAGAPVIVLVGVDKQNSDMTGGILGEEYIPCPPLCPSGSALYK